MNMWDSFLYYYIVLRCCFFLKINRIVVPILLLYNSHYKIFTFTFLILCHLLYNLLQRTSLQPSVNLCYLKKLAVEFLGQKVHVFKSLIDIGELSSRKTVLIFILSTLYVNFFSPQYLSILDLGPEKERQRGESLLKISGLDK